MTLIAVKREVAALIKQVFRGANVNAGDISGEETGDKSLYQNHLQSAEMTRVGRIMNETI